MTTPTPNFEQLFDQAQALIDLDTVDDVSKMANISAWLMKNFDFHWVGFYRVINNQLMLGPFQGPIACYLIDYGKGVCGTAWKTKSTQNIPDVHHFTGHIACSPFSNSELVIPCFKNGEIFAVLDIDSTSFDAFATEFQHFLERIAALV